MNTVNPKLSIITVCFNSEKTIESSLRSVIGQDYQTIEYIVIDGASTDSTMQIIEKYKAQIDVLISEKDNGIYEAMNKGIKNSTGDYIIFLNADDYYLHHTSILTAMEQINHKYDPTIDVYYGDVLMFNPSSGQGKIWQSGQINNFLLYRSSIAHPITIYGKASFEKAGMFDTSYRIVGDYEWLVRAYKKHGLKFKHIDYLFAQFNEGGISANENSNEQVAAERQQVINMYYKPSEIKYFKIRNRIKKLFGI